MGEQKDPYNNSPSFNSLEEGMKLCAASGNLKQKGTLATAQVQLPKTAMLWCSGLASFSKGLAIVSATVLVKVRVKQKKQATIRLERKV